MPVGVLLSALLLIGGLTAAGCGGHESIPAAPTPAGPAARADPARVGAYLEELLRVMQAEAANAGTVDWARMRADVFAAAGAAPTIRDAYSAIQVALQGLNDFESHYRGADGTLIGPSPEPACATEAETTPRVPDVIGYVKVGGCPCQGAAADQFAESVQRAIRVADRPGLAGWIVDLRHNGGGNMWPMIAGLGPVLGEGIIGWIVYNNREYEREYRDGAALSLGEIFARVAVPYTPLTRSPKVAVLTGGGTNSAGEAMAVWFRGRPDTRSFGAPTCGHHHLLDSFSMSDGAVLTLKNANNADRLKRPYAGPIHPETHTDRADTLDRAIAWLLGTA